MKNVIVPFAAAALLTTAAQAGSVPDNVRSLYNSIRQQGSCNNELKGGFYSQEQDSKSRSEPLLGPRSLELTVPKILATAVIIYLISASCIFKVKMAIW